MIEIRGYCCTPEPPPGPVFAAALDGTGWWVGERLRVCFMDGPNAYHDRVRAHAATWEQHANLRFDFGQDPYAEIRITFRKIGQFYSVVGRQAMGQGFPFDGHTMNLGFPWTWPLGDDDVEREIRRLTLHEFGHAIGLVHEHSSPEAGSFFKDPELVYAYYRRIYGWTREMVDQNVLNVYGPDRVSHATRFDPESIMLYEFPPEITTRPTHVNYELSELDKALIGTLYPRPKASS